MGLFGKRKKNTDSKVPSARTEAVSKSTFDKYFESAFSYQQQKLAEENASLAQMESVADNDTAVVTDDVTTLRNPVSDEIGRAHV